MPLDAVMRQALRHGRHQRCMHFDASPAVCDQLIDAHSVQRSRTLAQLIDSTNHVCTFDPRSTDHDGLYQLSRVGWRRASTFSGFCARHDSTTFARVETGVFVASSEQCFLLAYRALCHEIHQRTQTLKAQPHLRDAGDRGLPPEAQRIYQRQHDAIEGGLLRGLLNFESLKRRMDAELRARLYDGLASLVVTFDGPLNVAGAGLVSPNRDIDGEPLQDLADLSAQQESLFCNIIVTDCGGAVVLSWRHGTIAPKAFLRSVLKRPQNQIPTLLVQFTFAHLQNVYFSSKWWAGLRPTQKCHVQQLASIANPYYTPFEYRALSNLVPWRDIRLRESGLTQVCS
jgi:hypothetical protein